MASQVLIDLQLSLKLSKVIDNFFLSMYTEEVIHKWKVKLQLINTYVKKLM